MYSLQAALRCSASLRGALKRLCMRPDHGSHSVPIHGSMDRRINQSVYQSVDRSICLYLDLDLDLELVLVLDTDTERH